MAKWIFILAGVYLAAVLNSVVAPLVELRGVSPDFLALAAALGALSAGGSCGLFAAGLAGVLADLNAPGRLGLSVAIFVLASVAVSALRQLTLRRPLTQTLATWPAVTGILLSMAIARSALGESTWSIMASVSGSLAAGFYSALIGLPCYWLLDRFSRLRAAAY